MTITIFFFFLRGSQKGNPLLSLSFAVSAASMPFKMCCRLWGSFYRIAVTLLEYLVVKKEFIHDHI
jgi:hypothetical protein